MVNGYSLDPHPKANYAKECFAVIKMKSLKRDRVPSSNVEIVQNIDEALANADSEKNLYAAKIAGPARSSEGLELFYIINIFNS
jgi:hypothetical protein